MTRKLFLPLTLILLGVFLPVCGVAQSDSGEPSLGDLARLIRKGKAAPEHTVIDNDNLHQVMDEVQTRSSMAACCSALMPLQKSFRSPHPM